MATWKELKAGMRARHRAQAQRDALVARAGSLATRLYMRFRELPLERRQQFRDSTLKIRLRDALDDAQNGDPAGLDEARRLIAEAVPSDGVEEDARSDMLELFE